jgi:hypothetical protein
MARQLTFQDVMQFYDTGALTPIVSPDDSAFAKAMINTGLGTGVWNPIYGAQAWYQLNTEANLFGLLPKLTWDKSGFRTVSAFTRTNASMAISETGTLPTPTTPTINTIKLVPKVAVNTFQTSQVVEQLAKLSQDDIFANLDTIRMFYATEHVKLLNQQMNQVVVGTVPQGCQPGNIYYSGGSIVASFLAFESLDRIVSSYAEGVAIVGTGTATITVGTASATITAAQVVSPYAGAVARTSASAYDAQVVAPSGTIGTGAYLTDQSVRNLIQQTRTAGGFNNVFVTGYNTYAEIQGLYLSNWRTVTWGELKIDTGLNGIHSAEGLDVGVKVASLYGLPLISAVDTPASQYNGTVSAGVQNIYLLDATDTEGYGDSRFGVQVLNPTNYLETSARDFILLGALAYQGLYLTIGEQACRFFAAQGKLRDIN